MDGLGFQTLKQPRMVPNDITLIQSTNKGYWQYKSFIIYVIINTWKLNYCFAEVIQIDLKPNFLGGKFDFNGTIK